VRSVVTETQIPGLQLLARGRVRDVYDLDSQLLIVNTDRVPVANGTLPAGLPDKGRVLTQLAAFWFDQLRNTAPSHYLSSDFTQIASLLDSYDVEADAHLLAGRSMLVNKVRPLPVHVAVAGYLSPTHWPEYKASGRLLGTSVSPGLQPGDRLAAPLVQVTDADVSGGRTTLDREQIFHRVEPGHIDRATRDALALYEQAAAHSLGLDLILAEARFEFGVFQGMTILIGDCLTPDSARFWDAKLYQPGASPVGMGLQYLLDYLQRTGWDGQSPEPDVPTEVLARTAGSYRELFRRLTGTELD
jgi:phosphoribosylaminoimidazole-succinocarboxamide synthase